MPNQKEIIEFIYSTENTKRIGSDYERYLIYNGKLKEIIKKAIQKEFKQPETIEGLCERIVPINLTQKLINKLAGVYRVAPVREPQDGDENDQDAINTLEPILDINMQMKLDNRYFKLFKHSLTEIYIDSRGQPKLRALPSHVYTLFSDDPISPNEPTMVVKHLSLHANNRDKDLHAVWTDTEHYVMNGKGDIVSNPNNPDNINFYATLPFVYTNQSPDLLMPLQDDDLISMQIAICVLLTDLSFATKYQSWSIIYLIGAIAENLPVNPNSIISLPSKPDGTNPEIGTLKLSLDTDGILKQVEALVGLLLTTKSLSVGSVSTTLNQGNVASGIAKLIDESQSTEDKQDQESFYRKTEKEVWSKLKKVLDYAVPAGLIDPKFAVRLSDTFELGIRFQDMQPSISMKEKVEIEKSKVDANFQTQRMAIENLNPDKDDEEISEIINAIEKEKTEKMDAMVNTFVPQPPVAKELPIDNGEA